MRPLPSLAAVLGVLLASHVSAQMYPTRSGEAGILDVPDGSVVGVGRGMAAAELRFDRVGGANDFGPLPISVAGGVLEGLDLGFTMREWGQPGDPHPSRMLFGAAAKLSLWREAGGLPGASLSAVLDRFNDDAVAVARIAVSSSFERVRFAAFAGAEAAVAERAASPTFGGAVSMSVSRRLELAAEALTGPRGGNVGLAVRVPLADTRGVSLGANYFPDDRSFRIALTLAVSSPTQAARSEPTPAVAPPPTIAVAPVPEFNDDRPHFRLRLPLDGPLAMGEARRIQYGPSLSKAAPASVAPAPTGIRASAPSLEDLAEAQVREQETLADARELRIRSTAEQLDVREKAAVDEQKRLAERERDLAARDQALGSRERAIVVRGASTQQERQLESVEAQLASQERSLAAQERSYGPAIDGAQGRAREAAAREEAERQEATRLSASVSGLSSRALQVDARKQAVGARNRQLAALEARLVARGEFIDALERQLRTKSERLDASSRRLDARAERLDAQETRPAERKPTGSTPAPGGTGAAAAPERKAAFVMVVKSPTAIVKEPTSAPAAAGQGRAMQAGPAVEKAVAAATVLMFPSPTTQLSELDLEALTNVATLASKERCDLLIWARAKDQATMAEAQRRAMDLQTRALAAAPLDASRVVTRITVRPGAKGVDVVVSALREVAKPAERPAPAPASAQLLSGESGNRQIREAVGAVQPAIEACVGELLLRKKIARAEGVLKITLSPQGRVVRLATAGGDLSGSALDDCLGRASPAWVFPSADAGYAVDVPITVVGERSP